MACGLSHGKLPLCKTTAGMMLNANCTVLASLLLYAASWSWSSAFFVGNPVLFSGNIQTSPRQQRQQQHFRKHASRANLLTDDDPTPTAGAAPAAALRQSKTSSRDPSTSPLLGRRREARLRAVAEGIDGEDSVDTSLVLPESIAVSTVPPADDREGNGAGDGLGPSVDLAKGIAFEAPKPKGEEVEEEEASKKIRVILYTVLSLVPFLLLLPFLGDREFVPLDPGQM